MSRRAPADGRARASGGVTPGRRERTAPVELRGLDLISLNLHIGDHHARVDIGAPLACITPAALTLTSTSNELAPEPMVCEQLLLNLLDRHTLGLRDEGHGKHSHDEYPACREEQQQQQQEQS